MKLKAVVCLLAFFSFTAVAFAQDTAKVDIFAGYSYVRDNPSTSGVSSFNLHGGSASVAYNANHWLSAVADFGGYHANNILGSGIDGTISTYLFGPRVSYRKFERVTPFAQTLFGVAHASGSGFGVSSTSNAFAATFGGGMDVRLSHHFSFRPAQVEYLLTRFPEATSSRETQNNLRVSTGFVFHF
ncbi:MAG TPA: outer membrane beta-barrel protein [Candidatus Sulfotelmatobacter sp.]|jgi:outer membrane immunogenic protein|nr:outer membrane beta-barrel protein [Candidatus Sulfotelmatobacter sp.]